MRSAVEQSLHRRSAADGRPQVNAKASRALPLLRNEREHNMAPRHLWFSKIGSVTVICTIGSFLRAAPADLVDKAESRAEVSADGSAGHITNRTFEVLRDDNERAHFLLRKEVRESFREGFDGGPGRARIDAWRLPRSSGGKLLYSIAEPGDSIGWLSYPELLAVTIGACCASSGSYTVFNAATGKMLVYSNGEGGPSGNLATVKKNGNLTLLIGVHDDHGGRWPPLFSKNSKDMQLLVTTSTPIGINPKTCGLSKNARICLGWTTQRRTGPRATGQ